MFYLIIEFMKGSLPWSNIENKEVPHLLFLLCLTCSSQTALLAVPQTALLALLAVPQAALLAHLLTCCALDSPLAHLLCLLFLRLLCLLSCSHACFSQSTFSSWLLRQSVFGI